MGPKAVYQSPVASRQSEVAGRESNHRKVFSTSGETEHVRVLDFPTSSIVISLVGAKTMGSKMKRPPASSTVCVAGLITLPSRLMFSALIGFFDPLTGVMPSVTR